MTKILKKALTSIGFICLALCILLGLAIMPKKAVADDGAFTLQKTVFAEGEAIEVTANGSGTDWIGIFREGEETSIYWYYVAQHVGTFNLLNGTLNNGVVDKNITPGTYVIAYIPNDLSGLSNATQTQTITVTASALRVEKTRFAVGEAINVTATGSGADWVGIYRDGETFSARWYYVATAGSGATVNLATYGNNNEGNGISATIGEGNYTIYLVRNDGGYTDAEVAIPITVTSSSALYVEKTEFALKEPIYVTATHTDSTAWVGLYRVTESSYCRWYPVSDANGVAFDITKGQINIETSYSPNVMRGEYILKLFVSKTGTSSANEADYDVVATTQISVIADSTLPSAPLSATYTLANDTDGFATGTVQVKMPINDMTNRCIALFWGDERGVFDNYSYIKFKVTGETTSFAFGKNVIIPYGATKLYVYAKNTNGDALSEDCITIDLPKSAAHKNPLNTDTGEAFWIISDTHIDQDVNHVHNQHFAGLLKDISRIDGDAMSLIVNGDMTNRGRDKDFANFQAIYDAATGVPPMVLSMGNHEYYNGSYEYVNSKFYELAKYPDGSFVNKMHFDYWQGGYHFIFLGTDAWPQNNTHAVLNEATLNWLDAKLDENKESGKPKFLFLHQPLYNTVAGSRPGEDYSGVEASAETRLREILSDHPEVMMFNGHTHWTMNAEANMYEGTAELPTRIFNTSSAGYLWTTYDNASGDYLYGSEGYYVRVFGGTLYVMGYDFVNDQWISAAQYCVQLSSCNACVDNDKNHTCDVCDFVSVCADKDNNHTCDTCQVSVSRCDDSDNNHDCDICNQPLSSCNDEDNNHTCDVCKKELGACADKDNNHLCDTCQKTLSTCADKDNNHLCDTCKKTLSTCADKDNNHLCDTCQKALSVCLDTNTDGKCDICGKQGQENVPGDKEQEGSVDDKEENTTDNKEDVTEDEEGKDENETQKEQEEQEPQEEEETGCRSSLGGAMTAIGGMAVALYAFSKKKRR